MVFFKMEVDFLLRVSLKKEKKNVRFGSGNAVGAALAMELGETIVQVADVMFMTNVFPCYTTTALIL